MKIITWNANWKFREKFVLARRIGADICVIQECENPDCCEGRTIRERAQAEGYREFAANHLWWGDNTHHGIGIFAAPHVSLTDNGWDDGGYHWFGSARINNCFDLLAVWTNSSRGSNPLDYAHEFNGYFDRHADKIGVNTVVIGDFNSSPKWDAARRTNAYPGIAERLHAAGLVSAYHHCRGEMPGHETLDTRHRRGVPSESYHIATPLLPPHASSPATWSLTPSTTRMLPTIVRLCWSWMASDTWNRTGNTPFRGIMKAIPFLFRCVVALLVAANFCGCAHQPGASGASCGRKGACRVPLG